VRVTESMIRRMVREGLEDALTGEKPAAGSEIDMSKIVDSILTQERWNRVSSGYKVMPLNFKGQMSTAIYGKTEKGVMFRSVDLYSDKMYCVIFGVVGDEPVDCFLADSSGNSVAQAVKQRTTTGVTVYAIDDFVLDKPADSKHFMAVKTRSPREVRAAYEILSKDIAVVPAEKSGDKKKDGKGSEDKPSTPEPDEKVKVSKPATS